MRRYEVFNMKSKFQKLFTPVTIGMVEIKNRVVFLPHETHYGGEDHSPTKQQLYYYRERAKGGVGLIVIPSMDVHPSGSYAHTISAYTRESVPKLKEIVDDVHTHGASIFGQLTHFGNQTKSVETRQPLWAPSAVPDMTVREMPHEMTREEIGILIKSFASSAENLVEAGFDGVMIKAAHDGILHQYLSSLKNKRTDEYGGSIENRARIITDILKATRERIGNVPLGVRLNINEYMAGGYGIDDGIQFARIIAPFSDYLSVSHGTWESMPMVMPPMTVPQGFLLQDIGRVKAAITIPVIGSGRIIWPKMAEDALTKGQCDLIGMARQLIADPFWVEKARTGRTEEIVECIGCNQKCVGRLLQNRNISCVVNPASGYEERYGSDKIYAKSSHPMKVIIVGGGPAGMKAAEIAARRGHTVVLFEKEKTLGGRVIWESSLPQRNEYRGIIRYLVPSMKRLGVDVRTGVDVNPELVIREKPDMVIIATGAVPVTPAIDGLEGDRVFSSADVTAGQVKGRNVIVMDYAASPESAGVVEGLLDQGKTVQWVTAVFFAGQDLDITTLLPFYQRIGQKPVTMYPMTILLKVEDKTGFLLNPYTGKTSQLSDIDSVVIAGLKSPDNELYSQLKDRVPTIHSIGDATAPRDAAAALLDAMSLEYEGTS
jgi:2,4-dienoyl-CoA reductase (NADPH2)